MNCLNTTNILVFCVVSKVPAKMAATASAPGVSPATTSTAASALLDDLSKHEKVAMHRVDATDEAATASDAWNIMEDLEFLIATDAELQDEFSHVCDLLDDSFPIDDILPSWSESTADVLSDTTSNDASSPVSNTSLHEHKTQPPRAARKRVNRQKEEIRYLQKQVSALQAKLAHDKKRASNLTPFNMSAWEAAARQERLEKRRAVIENDQLRASIMEGSMFIQQIQTMMNKKPRWATVLATIYPTHATLRAAAIHAIADRQYHRQANAFILAQVVGQKDDLFRATPKTLSSGQNVLEVVNHTTIQLPYRIAMDAVWRTFRGDLGPMLLDDACSEVCRCFRTMENIDEWTRYERFSQRRRSKSLSGMEGFPASPRANHAPAIAFTNTIIKLFQEDGRDVLVFRSVLEDELEPHMTRRAVDDMAGWIVTSANSANTCGLTSVIHMPLETTPSPDMTTPEVRGLVEALKSLSFQPQTATQPPPVPGRDAFFKRAKLFDTAMKLALQDAVRDFSGASIIDSSN
ncbi:hypothetical protein DYB32_007746 [Aphanomyces invadans]|uniref:Uncharacterized protein n=1 Tax=Aphanomyces invadans TaxID=157072 RepID=A0A418AN96_9STRA|nr:hypothetical protein DYB32_007746 [Aphanomyces invadans]